MAVPENPDGSHPVYDAEDMDTEYVEGVGHVHSGMAEGARKEIPKPLVRAKNTALGLGIDWETGKWDGSVDKWKCDNSPAVYKKVALYVHPVNEKREGGTMWATGPIKGYQVWIKAGPSVCDEKDEIVEGGHDLLMVTISKLTVNLLTS